MLCFTRSDITKIHVYLWLLHLSFILCLHFHMSVLKTVVHLQSSRRSNPTSHCHQGRTCPADNGWYQGSPQDLSASLEGKVFKIRVIFFFIQTCICTSRSVLSTVSVTSFGIPVIMTHFIFITKTCNQGLIMWPLKFLLRDETFSTNLCLNLVLTFLLSLKLSQPFSLKSKCLANRNALLLSDELLM